MKYTTLFFVVQGVLAVSLKQPAENNNGADSYGSRIIDGQLAEEGQFPYQVSIKRYTDHGNFYCNGALLNDRWVITAAHCIYGVNMFSVYLGSTKLGGGPAVGGIELNTEDVHMHPYFIPSNLRHDIGLIALAVPVNFTDKIQPIRLPTATDHIDEGVAVTVSGWGKTRDTEGSSDDLYYVNATTITNDECKEAFSNVFDTTVCVVGEAQESPCRGDSGSPLVATDEEGNPYQVGVMSFGRYPCNETLPTGYSRPEYYLSWIKMMTGLE